MGAVNLELVPPRELALAWVRAARDLLGGAPSYSETPVAFSAASMTVGAAGEPERYILTVQRAGKITPHQARLEAEAERDKLASELAGMETMAVQTRDFNEKQFQALRGAILEAIGLPRDAR